MNHFSIPDENRYGDSTKGLTIDEGADDGWEVVSESEMRRRERDNIIAALNKCDWKISGAGGGELLIFSALNRRRSLHGLRK